MRSYYYMTEYKSLSRALNTFDACDQLKVRARLVYLRGILGISSAPRDMSGWAHRTTMAKNYPNTPAPSLI